MPWEYDFEYLPDLSQPSLGDYDHLEPEAVEAAASAFLSRIASAQSQCGENERIKVWELTRHGEAWHNRMWELFRHRSIERSTYVVHKEHPVRDPLLTGTGRSQAYETRGEMNHQATSLGMPRAEIIFVSPTRRAGETCGIVYGWMYGDDTDDQARDADDAAMLEKVQAASERLLALQALEDSGQTPSEPEEGLHVDREGWEGVDMGHGVPAIVLEKLREHLHNFQCDKRLSVTELKRYFPTFDFTHTASDQDTVWKPESVRQRETNEERRDRGKSVVSFIAALTFDSATFIGLVAHSRIYQDGICPGLGVPPESSTFSTAERKLFVTKITRRWVPDPAETSMETEEMG